jgi:hypothetical protein
VSSLLVCLAIGKFLGVPIWVSLVPFILVVSFALAIAWYYGALDGPKINGKKS